ncbi:glycoside hydrolase family 2 TIM barrel-domain containing protein [Arthrobacter sp. W4I7]|uniref:glycoside hydrolase family 2 TIM barrel-domain containing protein n=1 Tax=Arthrobacter sp. W4I7 TaxID=3042296 RepID=UPI00278B85F1|nr:glycoside hydrolase family 2 TIM barrel-domain containing protein [Arthrobacter sp. W4I7]MDQ0691298.1 beta-galactosidase [Arthrobacter sp. W4I7]
MRKEAFNTGWAFRPKVGPFDELSPDAQYVPVDLPHDALIGAERSPSALGSNAYFAGGAFQYRKTFSVPESSQNRRFSIFFEGVYRDAMIYVNGAFAGQRPYGYSGFEIDLTPHLVLDAENEIVVEARSHEDSRWYTGAGIYRDVWLLTGDEVHIAADGPTVRTVDQEATLAVLEVVVPLETTSPRLATSRIEVEIADATGRVIDSASAVVTTEPGQTVVARQRLFVEDPELWSAESPNLYSVTTRLLEGERIIESHTVRTGIRTVRVDHRSGLRVNGVTVKLRGACIHADNGILGAATFADAEERRIRILKKAGFNAIRSSHNPLSVPMIQACDRLGMYVIDEAFDMWASTKTSSDYALRFAEWWERDIEAMVAKDLNHASVIGYSIGNEIPEVGSPAGAATNRRLAEKVRALDGDRFVTNGVNSLLAVMFDLKSATGGAGGAGGFAEQAGGINTMMAAPGGVMNAIAASPLATEKTEESLGALDVAGMNYGDSRYELDRELFPRRVIVGSETFPGRIDETWPLVMALDTVIGDFTWTGWDYLGEVGLGRSIAAGDQSVQSGLTAPYPWIAAWSGDIDLLGTRRPLSFYREMIFGLRADPYIAVLRPGRHAGETLTSPWAWSDSVSSWAWDVPVGTPLDIEIYSPAGEVEIVLNGRSLGRVVSSPDNRFRPGFTVPFEPGELVAISTIDGTTRSHSLRSAHSETGVVPTIERGRQLVFVELRLADAEGTTSIGIDRELTIEVEGEARLLAFGSADPAPAGGYAGRTTMTFDGRALAILRADPTTTIIRVTDGGAEGAVTEFTI